MAVVKKHWLNLVLSLVICGLVTLGISIPYLLSGSVQAQLAETQPEIEPRILDAPTYSLVQQIRGKLELSDQDLAAIGCSQRQAEELLASIADWVELNKVALNESSRIKHSAQQNLQEAYRKMNLGVAGNHHEQIAHQRQIILDTNKQHLQQLDSLSTALSAKLNTEQSTLWDNAKSKRISSQNLKYLPDLTDQQIASITSADSASRLQTSTTTLDRELTYNQRQILSLVTANRQIRLPEVKQAGRTILPKPSELVDSPSTGESINPSLLLQR